MYLKDNHNIQLTKKFQEKHLRTKYISSIYIYLENRLHCVQMRGVPFNATAKDISDVSFKI